MSFQFERLKAYQRGIEFASTVHALTGRFKPGHASLIDQLRRASSSIPTNLAEGCGRHHANEKKQFYRIARGSAYECVAHLKLAANIKLLTLGEYQQLYGSLELIGKMITSLIASVDRPAAPTQK